MNSAPETEDQIRSPLRRASYVHVSDLTSAYNIDHGLLEQELNRTNSESRAEASQPRANYTDSQADTSTVATELNVSLASNSQKRLQPPRGGFNLCVLVGNVNIVVDKRRVDASRVRLAEVEIGDETGTVSLRARDEQIDVFLKVSARAGAVVLRNCTLELYQGRHIRLAITKWGKLSIYPDSIASTPPPPSRMNLERNFSRIDLTVVASEMVDTQPDAYRPYRMMTETSEPGGRLPPSKDSVQSSSKQHNQSRRNSRDRRPNRGKPQVFGNRSHYKLGENERRMLQQNQLNYRGMHGYSRFPEQFSVSHYPYPLGGHHEVLPAVSAQQILFQHQYEMQPGHFQQPYAHTQDQNSHVASQGATPGFIIDPNSGGAFPPSSLIPQVLPSDGSGLTRPIGMNPKISVNITQANSQLPPTSAPMQMAQRRPVSPEEAQRTRMNPDAMAFAPSTYSQILSQPYFPAYLHSHSAAPSTFGQQPQYTQASDNSLTLGSLPPQRVAPSEPQGTTHPTGNEGGAKSQNKS